MAIAFLVTLHPGCDGGGQEWGLPKRAVAPEVQGRQLLRPKFCQGVAEKFGSAKLPGPLRGGSWWFNMGGDALSSAQADGGFRLHLLLVGIG